MVHMTITADTMTTVPTRATKANITAMGIMKVNITKVKTTRKKPLTANVSVPFFDGTST